MRRTILFGDVHGCHDEWRDLIAKLRAGPDDDLISVGDLICKGPDSAATLDLAFSLPNLRCVIGNHEERHLRAWRGGRDLSAPHDLEVIAQLADRYEPYLEKIASWPYYLDEPDFLVVHAGLRPGVPLEEQSVDDLVSLRTLGPEGPPWYVRYDGPKLVVYGHWAMAGLVVRDRTIGLDTGCVYGGELTALVLPDRDLVSVPARRQYVDPLS